MHFNRLLKLPLVPKRSFFLWGPRLAGKTSLLHQAYPDALFVDLLRSEEFLRFAEQPSLLRQVAEQHRDKLIVIDEVQKVPLLLDEVHWLIENRGVTFVMCGSSARKVRHGHANLLGGRALRYELHGLLAKEMDLSFDLVRLLNSGNLPLHYLSEDFAADLDAYVGDYLKEEIAAESLVRNLPRFVDFLRVAAVCDTETVDYTKIASECGVTSATVRNHYQILEDTLLGFFLPAYARRQKRRTIQAPKFFFANVGVVNQLAKRKCLEPKGAVFGKAFENWLTNEIRTYNTYREKRWDLSFWRLSSGGEVDLIVNDMEFAVEFKSSGRISNTHLKSLRMLRQDFPKLKRRIVVGLESLARKTEDGIEILPAEEFLSLLWDDALA